MKKCYVLVLLSLLLCGCTVNNGEKTVEDNLGNTIESSVLVVTETISNSFGKSLTNHYEFTNLQVDDEIYGGFATITVKDVDKTRVVLNTEGLIEPNEDGTINLRKQGPTTITLNLGEKIELVTQTMDAGARLTLQYGFY